MTSSRSAAAASLAAILFAAPVVQAQVSAATSDLSLYDVKLKGATLADLMKAAGNAGAMSMPDYTSGGHTTVSVEHVGVPGMRQFAVVEDRGLVLSVQFLLTEDDPKANAALRELLVRKYGPPAVLSKHSAIGRTFVTSQISPSGVFEWQFNDGMKLSYVQKPDGSAPHLFYTDVMGLSLYAQRQAATQDAKQRDETLQQFNALTRGF